MQDIAATAGNIHVEVRMRVLIADRKKEECQALLWDVFQDTPYQQNVMTVEDGRGLLNYLAAKEVDLCILDASLDQLDISAILEMLRVETKTRLIILSDGTDLKNIQPILESCDVRLFLRPVDSGRLATCLEEMEEMIQEEKRNGKHMEVCRRFIIMNTQDIKAPLAQPLEKTNLLFSTHFREGLFRVVFIRLDLRSDDADSYTDIVLPYREQVHEICNSVLMPFCYDLILGTQFNGFKFLINYPVKHDNPIREMLSKILEKVQRCYKKLENMEITLCVSEPFEELVQLEQAVNEADIVNWSRKARGLGKVIFFEKDMELPERYKQKMEELYKRIIKSMENLDVEQFQRSISEFFCLPKSVIGTAETQKLLDDTIQFFFQVNGSLIDTLADSRKMKDSLVRSLKECGHLKDYKLRYVNRFVELMGQLQEVVSRQKAKPVRKAMQYVEEHYAEHINLEVVSEAVGLSPIYFSNIFKKETGKNFTEYVTEYRIEKAKIYLKDDRMNINEVAFSVGYQDQRYFSKLFKKQVGVTPKVYKNIWNLPDSRT